MSTPERNGAPESAPELDSLPLFASDDDSLIETDLDPLEVSASPTQIPGLATTSTDAWVNGQSEPSTRRARRQSATVEVGHRSEVDWSQVRALRERASQRLSEAVSSRDVTSRAEERELGRQIVTDMLEEAANADTVGGRRPWTPDQQQAMAEAVFDSLFRLGRLQPLVDDERVENIEITGSDAVILELSDGSLVEAPPVADTDEDLLDFLRFLATRNDTASRPFSQSNPSLHLRLDGGARLAATAWVTPRPTVVIRRHRLRSVTLQDLVERQALTPAAANFLAAAVRAKRSIVVAGPQGAGKTTLVRALCAEIDPLEPIGTFETEYELHLHELPEQHRRVKAWEARPGTGERGIDGRQAGEWTLADCLFDSFRFNLSRQIVGEVRGHEILAMIKAMESGAGSISTTHATTADRAIRKLVTCALEAGPQITQEYALRAVTENINLVVQLHLRSFPTEEGISRQRWVSEIIAIHPGERERGYATTHIFRSNGAGPATAQTFPDDYRDLIDWGFDLEAFNRERALEGVNTR